MYTLPKALDKFIFRSIIDNVRSESRDASSIRKNYGSPTSL